MKWMYKENAGVLAKGNEIEQLSEHFTQSKPNDLKKFKHITFHQAINLIGKAKESVKEEDEKKEAVKEEAIDCSGWNRQKCDGFLKKNGVNIPDEKGVNAGREAVTKFING
jgi:glycyl-tRNA synthetase (class II)